MDTVFSLCSAAASVGWLLLILAPRWRVTRVASGVAIPLAIALVYLTLIGRYMPGAAGGFGSLADVALLFDQQGLLLAGWVHYLAFDLFIGSWEVRDANQHHVPHLLVVPCLIMTFMLGPIGLLAYFAVRLWRARTLLPGAA
ncbi:MAG: ABA4-like family protein [Acidobacteriota bacterium]|nr:ABA4-like family protein [Acidobacteriota bacterium]